MNKTISLGSKLNMVGMFTIDFKEWNIFKSVKEVLGLLTNFGLICFGKGSKEVVDFIPLADSEIL